MALLDFTSWSNSGSPKSNGRSAEGGYGGGFSSAANLAAHGFDAISAALGFANNFPEEEDSGYPYGGYGYGGGSSGPDPAQIQKQIDNLIANANKRGGDLGDLVADNLGSIKKQIKQNEDLYKKTKRDNMLQLDWQPQQQRQQSTLMALRNRMGNAAWGSSLVDLAEGMGRVDDMADVQLINTYKQNENSAFNDWLQADTALKADYSDMVNQYRDEMSKLQSQTQSSLSNYDADAGNISNLEAIARGETVTTNGDESYTLNAAGNLTPRTFESLEFSEAKNPATYDMIRPDKGETNYNVNQDAGNANRSTAANNAFNDNLSAFRVRDKEQKWDTV